MNNPVMLIVAIPLIITLLNLIFPVIIRKLLTFLGLLVGLYFIYGFYQESPASIDLWRFKIAALDSLSLFTLTFIHILGFVILIFSLKGVEKGAEKRFFVLYPLTLAFCNGVVLSQNALAFLIFWGLSGLTLYWFALLGNGKNAPAMAKKTFILIGGSDAFLLMGLAIMWMSTGGSWSLENPLINLDTSQSYIAFFLLLIAAFAKAGGFPFHTWVPDFSKEAPVEGVALLPASLDKLLGIYLLARMMMNYFKVDLLINLIIITLGALTVIFAVMMAMVQHNGRRLLGYHAVSQVGYMIMGVGSGSLLAFAGGLFHLINHTIYKSNLFLSLGSVEKQTGTNDLDDLGGLGKLMPLTLIMSLIGALSISGIPPFNGFFSKWMIYQGLLDRAGEVGMNAGYQLWLLICLVLAVFGSALTLASFMKFIHAIYLGKRPQKLDKIKEAPFNQWLATGILSVFCIGFGVFANEIPLSRFVFPAMRNVLVPPYPYLGLYSPQLVLILFVIGFVMGLVIYWLTRKVRFDELYLGGNSPLEQFRVAGTEFYNEVRNMQPLKSLFTWAERKYFDIYDLGANSTFAFSHLLQKAHPGQLQLYLLYIIVGLLIFIARVQ